MSPRPLKRIFPLLLPVLLAIASITACLAFSRIYMSHVMTQFIGDFRHQNFAELSSGDTFSLAQRLNALTNSLHVRCIHASRNNLAFFDKKSGSCATDLLSVAATVTDAAGQGIAIRFVFSLPRELLWLCVAFITLQLAVLILLGRASTRAERFRLHAQIEISRIAAQVAHDIRSPLSALEAISTEIHRLPETQRTILQAAIARIHGIAIQLLDKYRELKPATTATPSDPAEDGESSVEDVSLLVSALLAEQRLRFREKPDVEIIQEEGGDAGGLLASVQPTELQRILSNLITNAVESIPEKGRVTVGLRASGDAITLRIADNGKGIPPEILPRLGRQGQTHGKPGGSGLGLYHAKTTIERWGGQCEITSEYGHGTTVSLTLPKAPATTGFISERTPIKQQRPDYVLIDDDAIVHLLWKHAAARDGKTLVMFRSVDDFMAHASRLDRTTPIYLDSHLGCNQRGEVLAEAIFRIGFEQIWLCTGLPSDQFPRNPYLKGVVSKDPPWQGK
jgi:signal transduction histidine kinase